MNPDPELLTVAVVTFCALAASYLWWSYEHNKHLAAMRDRAELRRRMLAKVGLCDKCNGVCGKRQLMTREFYDRYTRSGDY